MVVDNNIFAVVEPEIKPTEIKVNSLGEEKGNKKQSKIVATVEPYISINGYDFKEEEVNYFRLTLGGKLPMLEVSVVDGKNIFDTEFYPRDGDCVTILVNSKNSDTFKSIHMDFDITEVETSKDVAAGKPTVNITGVAKIPKIAAETCKYYEDGPSLDHLEMVARELKLGMATNITETQDKQPRIQAWTSYRDFINNIVSDSYVSEESFTEWYIDQFYYLNFIDVNRIFDSENPSIGELQENFASLQASLAEDGDQKEDADNIKMPLILTNQTSFKTTNNFIESYNVVNQSSSVSLKNGYGRIISYYDDNAPKGQRHTEYKVEPFVSKSMPDSDAPLRGRFGDEGQERFDAGIKHKWLGRINAGEDGLGNTHPNYLHSLMVDVQNKTELNKMYMKVKLETFNPSVYKYQKVPVIIYDTNAQSVSLRKQAKEAAKELGTVNDTLNSDPEGNLLNEGEKPNEVQNTMLTGYYVIANIDYEYSSTNSKLMQELTLIRREWPASAAVLAVETQKKDESSTPAADNAV
jgi:hypothetical protein